MTVVATGYGDRPTRRSSASGRHVQEPAGEPRIRRAEQQDLSLDFEVPEFVPATASQLGDRQPFAVREETRSVAARVAWPAPHPANHTRFWLAANLRPASVLGRPCANSTGTPCVLARLGFPGQKRAWFRQDEALDWTPCLLNEALSRRDIS